MKVDNVYSSIACNRNPEAADWGHNNLVLFGACNAVAVFDPSYNSSSKIIQTFVEHTARVNCVKWIKSSMNDHVEFVSGSNDQTCILWNVENIHSNEPTISTRKLQGHVGGVTVVEAIYIGERLTIATASTDSTIKLWRQTDDNIITCVQTISLGDGLCFAIRMCRLPDTEAILMAVATDDDKIHLYCERDDSDFGEVERLIGHEDWVRGLDFIVNDANELLLASSGQDTFIRLWKITPLLATHEPYKQVADLLPNEDIKVEERICVISLKGGLKYRFAIALESVLLGHDGWVYGVHWNRLPDGRLQLLSSSIDKTMILWTPLEDGVWMERIRVGDVGGNSLGFFGGKISSDGSAILGHGYQGSFHIWRQEQENPQSWLPGIVAGGHFGEARDIAWEQQGTYLISVSSDQTSRIHVPWKRDTFDVTWHELARPQVHGYDMQTVAMLERYRFASGAEEKIVRTFQAPGNFVENLRRLSGLPITDPEDPSGNAILASRSKGASVPSLGLSNKAVNESALEVQTEQKHIKDEYPENYFVPVTLNEPPPEETLMQNTLWPETQKLYGHGYDVYSLCATSDGKLLASSCKATNAEHAQIILWNTSTWKQQQQLSAHQLTITQMKFSPDNKWLLSVSRDRRWALFENQSTDGSYDFRLKTMPDKKNGIHSRIIWTCDWSHDSKLFATGSRDGKCVIWKCGDALRTAAHEDVDASLGGVVALHTIELKNQSITAVAFSHSNFHSSDEYLLAAGTDGGVIRLFCVGGSTFTELHTLSTSQAHHLTVRKLAFRPKNSDVQSVVQLASCGDDHLVRIYQINVEE